MPDNDNDAADELAILDLPRDRIAGIFAYRHWLLTAAREITDPHAIVEGVGAGLLAAGVSLDRMMTAVEVRHSERLGVGSIWEPGKPSQELFFPHGPDNDDAYQASPFLTAHETGRWVRFDPRLPAGDRYSITADLREAGFTDYICIPVFSAGGFKNGITFASRAEQGFSETDMATLRFLLPTLASFMELLVLRRMLNEVTRIYLGAEPAERVLSGDVRRGAVVPIRSVILFADMRRFTATSMNLSAQETVDLLNVYYDCVVAPVERRGGEILKFIGDGVLAIFRADAGSEMEIAQRAIAASREALSAVASANRENRAPAPFEIGIGLHLGEVAYGNVGSGERQDYTVIGRDVNLASRIAGLCGKLDVALILSGAFAACLESQETHEAGYHRLKGVPDPTPVFTARET